MIIGISGKRGTGKSSAATYLREEYGFRIVSFSTRLKEIAREFFEFDASHFGSKKEQPYDIYDWTPRDFLIALGQMGRFFDSQFWVKAAELDKATGNVVVDDVRFPNEADYMKTLGAKIIRLERYEKLNVFGKNIEDPSETSMDNYKFDYRVEDCVNITLNDLFNQMDICMRELK